jgi:heptosyltransferase II
MKTLIIKLGALGDVMRTTVLLNVIDGEIYWLTKKDAEDLLRSKKIKRRFFVDSGQDVEEMNSIKFDRVISLDEEPKALDILKSLSYDEIVGIFSDNNGKIDYTDDSKYWFDMSLSSKFGKRRADELKKLNRKSVPQILIEMLGFKWKGQEYDLGIIPRDISKKIGIIKISTGVWQNKQWTGYDTLFHKLKDEGFEVSFLGIRRTIGEHIEDINRCGVVVCGDTLGMHIALALKKKVVALFNCTSPDEIYGYERMTKIISPFYDKYFYVKELREEAISAIGVGEVYLAVKKALKG